MTKPPAGDAELNARLGRYYAASAAFDADETGDDTSGEHVAAMASVMAFTPRTLGEAAAMMRAVQSFDDDPYSTWCKDIREPGRTLFGRIADCLEQLDRAQAK